MSATPTAPGHTNAVTFDLGDDQTIAPLFAFRPEGTTVADCIAHGINQSLLRDLNYGAWAQVSGDTTMPYHVRISAPSAHIDLESYASRYQGYLAAVATALAIFEQNRSKLPATGVSFVPPFGLAMANVQSIQLLHYPPSGTLTYMDYLYSATNRRCENLLAYNGFNGAHNTLVERIVDLVPIAADGGPAGAAAIESVQDAFTTAYLPAMLNVFLAPSPHGTATQPLVAYGGPVIEYLKTLNPTDLNKDDPNKKDATIGPLSLFTIQLMKGGPPTHVLCANHPSQFMYVGSESKQGPPTDFKKVLLQDLIAAGWQAHMAQHPDDDPLATLRSVSARWDKRGWLVDEIYAEQVAEFTRAKLTPSTVM